jgi:hypothetical protein
MKWYDKHRAGGFNEYTFAYLANSISLKIPILEMLKRIGNPQSDWTNSVWGSPVVALAPPREHDHKLALNIDTYLTYVDKQIIRRS